MLLGATLLPVADVLSSETSEGVNLISITGCNWLLLIIGISNVMRELWGYFHLFKILNFVSKLHFRPKFQIYDYGHQIFSLT